MDLGKLSSANPSGDFSLLFIGKSTGSRPVPFGVGHKHVYNHTRSLAQASVLRGDFAQKLHGVPFPVGKKIARARAYARPAITQSELAEALSLSRDAVANYETGRSKVPLETLRKIASMTGFPIQWFTDGEDSEPPPDNKLAILTSVEETAAASSTVEIEYLGVVPCGGWEMPTSDSAKIAVSATVATLRGEVAAVRVSGDSMEPRFRHGDIVVIRKSATPIDGQIVLASNQDRELTLKVLRYRANGWELHSFNPAYPPTLADEWSLIGYAVHREESDEHGLRP